MCVIPPAKPEGFFMASPSPILRKTADGSLTFYNEHVGEHYHSVHGALQEALHVFVGAGWEGYRERYPEQESIAILEVGFGTGLNFLLTADRCLQQEKLLRYQGIEAYPLVSELFEQTGYSNYIEHKAVWEALLQQYPDLIDQGDVQSICPSIDLKIVKSTLLEFSTQELVDIIYFDAFAAVHQPEMWTEEAIAHTCSFLKPGGIFVTYSITGHLKRCLKALGFTIEKLPGAAFKREMLRAYKN